MIDKLSYEEVLSNSEELRKQAGIVSKLASSRNIQELIDFAATVEGYSKFLENTIEIKVTAENGNEKIYKLLVTVKDKNPITVKIDEKNFDKTFKQSLIRFLVSMIIKNFSEEYYDSLDFTKLNPYQEAKEMILLIIRLMKKINYLDLSYANINDDNFLSKLLDKIEKRDKFSLFLEGIDINKDLVKKIKLITDTNLDIKIKINNIYNGQLHFYGGKKMNKEKNKNKKKFKNIEFK